MLTIKDILADKQTNKYIRLIMLPDTRNYYDRWSGCSSFAPTPSDLMNYSRLHIYVFILPGLKDNYYK